jgi:hypothetical protein
MSGGADDGGVPIGSLPVLEPVAVAALAARLENLGLVRLRGGEAAPPPPGSFALTHLLQRERHGGTITYVLA